MHWKIAAPTIEKEKSAQTGDKRTRNEIARDTDGELLTLIKIIEMQSINYTHARDWLRERKTTKQHHFKSNFERRCTTPKQGNVTTCCNLVKVICFQLNQHKTSNSVEFTLTITVIYIKQSGDV